MSKLVITDLTVLRYNGPTQPEAFNDLELLLDVILINLHKIALTVTFSNEFLNKKRESLN
jgi:hypothetical protein